MTTRPSVLIIDDDERTHTLLQDMLDVLGIDLHFAVDSQTGLEIARSIHPDLIMLDLRLPEPSLPGWEVVPLLKSDPQVADIPVLIMSASGSDAIMRAMKAGADDFVEKPFSILPLRRKISRFVGLVEN